MSNPALQKEMDADLLQACELTQQMIDLIESADMDSIIKLDQQRQQLIQQVFSQDKDLIDQVQSQRLLKLNDSAVLAIKNKMKDNVTKQKKQRLVSKAHLAYTSHS